MILAVASAQGSGRRYRGGTWFESTAAHQSILFLNASEGDGDREPFRLEQSSDQRVRNKFPESLRWHPAPDHEQFVELRCAVCPENVGGFGDR